MFLPLRHLGMTQREESAYLFLIENPCSGLDSIAEALEVDRDQALRVLEKMACKGLISHNAESECRYSPVPPDIVLKALVQSRQEQLLTVEPVITELSARYNTALRGRRLIENQLIEVVPRNLDVERQIFTQIQETAREHVLTLERPPMRISRPPDMDNVEVEAMARGVRYRSIADRAMLELPGAIRAISNCVQRGDETRIYPELPFKMVLVDRKIALVPLSPEEEESPLLLVRAVPILSALSDLFELLWEKSIAFMQGARSMGKPDEEVGEQEDLLVPMLATGLNDKTIQYKLGISQSTLTRRIKALMKRFDASTRFELAWKLCEARQQTWEEGKRTRKQA